MSEQPEDEAQEPDEESAESLLRPSSEQKRAQETVMLSGDNLSDMMAEAKAATPDAGASGADDGAEDEEDASFNVMALVMIGILLVGVIIVAVVVFTR